MIAEIISIGTELILGDVNDSNSTFIARQLTAAGFDIHYITVTGDNEKRLIAAIKMAISRADIIITTGGLGPTEDDITRKAIAEAIGISLEQDQDEVSRIKSFFKEKNLTLTDNNFRQAYFPRGAQVLNNKWGTAPGFIINKKDIKIICLPGVPDEMEKMYKYKVAPFLESLQQRIIKSKVLHFFGIGESTLEKRIQDILNKQDNPTIALLAGKGEVKIRITASGSSQNDIYKLVNQTEEKIRQKVGEYIYGINEETLASVAGKILKEKKKMIALAESCTGGLLADRITDIPGSSNYFVGGVVAYSNKIKKMLLQVKKETLQKRGAVSEKTVQEMATGVKNLMNSDIGLSISGIAGPGGGTREKPVGLVYIGINYNNNLNVYRLRLNGERTWNKWMITQHALFYLIQTLQRG